MPKRNSPSKTNAPRGAKLVKRTIRGKIRQARIWKDASGKRHQKLLVKPTPEQQFEKRYENAVRDAKMMKRKLPAETIGIMREAAKLEQEEYAGGIDFEPGTKKVERILLTRGSHTESGVTPAAYAPADERKDFELHFHTHPAGKNKSGKGWDRGPSNVDISIAKLKYPEIVVQLEAVGKQDKGKERTKIKFYIVRSAKQGKTTTEEIDRYKSRAVATAMRKHKDVPWGAAFNKVVKRELKREFNKNGIDVKEFNPSKEPVWITRDQQKEYRRDVKLTRMRQRRMSEKNRRKQWETHKGPKPKPTI